MEFNIAINEVKDPYKGMNRRDRKEALRKDDEVANLKKRTKKVFDYAASLLGAK